MWTHAQKLFKWVGKRFRFNGVKTYENGGNAITIEGSIIGVVLSTDGFLFTTSVLSYEGRPYQLLATSDKPTEKDQWWLLPVHEYHGTTKCTGELKILDK